MKDILNRMLNHEELSREEMKNILIGITQSEFPTEQITALLTALQMRGVTVDELLGFRDGILETGVPAILNADRYIDVGWLSTVTMPPLLYQVHQTSSLITALSSPMISTN